jgi:hypothetical protein
MGRLSVRFTSGSKILSSGDTVGECNLSISIMAPFDELAKLYFVSGSFALPVPVGWDLQGVFVWDPFVAGWATKMQ